MKNLIDITKIDLRFEKLRLKNPKEEGILWISIIERGIEDPIAGILNDNIFILLDGFKRYRCAVKCKITEIPYIIYSEDEMSGVINLLKISSEKSLHILEQAKIVQELVNVYNLTMNDVASKLGKSSNWVRMRMALLSELTPLCLQKIFDGSFPVWCALGKLRQLKRFHKFSDDKVDEFINIVCGQFLSCRDIDLLAQGYFSGHLNRDKLKDNDFNWAIDKMKKLSLSENNFSNSNRQFIKDLEIAQKYIGRLIIKSPYWDKKNTEFMSVATILAEGILDKIERLRDTLYNFIEDFNNDRP